MSRPVAAHGTHSKYSRGCPCVPCREAERDYQTLRRRRAGIKPLNRRAPRTRHMTAGQRAEEIADFRDMGMSDSWIADKLGVQVESLARRHACVA